MVCGGESYTCETHLKEERGYKKETNQPSGKSVLSGYEADTPKVLERG